MSRPFGIGPYGTGLYSRDGAGPAPYDVAGMTQIVFSVSAPLELTWPGWAPCMPGGWAATDGCAPGTWTAPGVCGSGSWTGTTLP